MLCSSSTNKAPFSVKHSMMQVCVWGVAPAGCNKLLPLVTAAQQMTSPVGIARNMAGQHVQHSWHSCYWLACADT